MFDYLLLTAFHSACRQSYYDKECCLLHYDKQWKKRSTQEINARSAMALLYADHRAGVQRELNTLHKQVRITGK